MSGAATYSLGDINGLNAPQSAQETCEDTLETSSWCSVAEVAEHFGRSTRSIRRWVASGHLNVVKVGRSVFIDRRTVRALVSAEIQAALKSTSRPEHAAKKNGYLQAKCNRHKSLEPITSDFNSE